MEINDLIDKTYRERINHYNMNNPTIKKLHEELKEFCEILKHKIEIETFIK